MNTKIKDRLFIVGCPRSGTTLLQSFISAHSGVISFPESKFFNLLVTPGSRRSKLHLPGSKARETFYDFLDEIDCPHMRNKLPRMSIFLNQYASAFIAVLDSVAHSHGKNCWVEKTPSHVQRINCIEKLVPNAKFIHIIRSGEDVVASLYEVTHKHPGIWGGTRSIDQCLNRWMNDVSISECHRFRENHFIIRYEDLIESTEPILRQTFQFLNIQFQCSILEDYRSTAKRVTRHREEWKVSATEDIQKTRHKKFNMIFNDSQQKYILSRIEAFNICKPYSRDYAWYNTDCSVV